MQTRGREGKGRMNWESGTDMNILPCAKQIASGEPAARHGKLSLMLCDGLGEDGEGRDRRWVYVYIYS